MDALGICIDIPSRKSFSQVEEFRTAALIRDRDALRGNQKSGGATGVDEARLERRSGNVAAKART
jgi:hypothetical protein